LYQVYVENWSFLTKTGQFRIKGIFENGIFKNHHKKSFIKFSLKMPISTLFAKTE